VFGFRCPETVRDYLEERAEENHMSCGGYVLSLIKRDMAANYKIKKKKGEKDEKRAGK
jgi:hypothetical protein